MVTAATTPTTVPTMAPVASPLLVPGAGGTGGGGGGTVMLYTCGIIILQGFDSTLPCPGATAPCRIPKAEAFQARFGAHGQRARRRRIPHIQSGVFSCDTGGDTGASSAP